MTWDLLVPIGISRCTNSSTFFVVTVLSCSACKHPTNMKATRPAKNHFDTLITIASPSPEPTPVAYRDYIQPSPEFREL